MRTTIPYEYLVEWGFSFFDLNNTDDFVDFSTAKLIEAKNGTITMYTDNLPVDRNEIEYHAMDIRKATRKIQQIGVQISRSEGKYNCQGWVRHKNQILFFDSFGIDLTPGKYYFGEFCIEEIIPGDKNSRIAKIIKFDTPAVEERK